MDFDYPPDDDPRRLEVRSWLSGHPDPGAQDLVDAGRFAQGLVARFDDQIGRIELDAENPIVVPLVDPRVSLLEA